MRKLPDTQRVILAEMAKGTELRRVQEFAWAKVKYLLGDKAVSQGSVAGCAMAGFIHPIGKVEIGAPLIRYELTEKGRAAIAQAAA